MQLMWTLLLQDLLILGNYGIILVYAHAYKTTEMEEYRRKKTFISQTYSKCWKQQLQWMRFGKSI